MEFTLYAICWYFCIYAMLGWCLEVCFCTINTGKFVNRGFLNGPVCPIYGFGMVIILLCLWPLREHLLLLFAGSVLLTSALELVAGWVLKKIFHTSWWDYSDVPFNLGGYICLKFSLAWGVAGVFAVKAVHPLVAGLVSLMPHTLGVVALCFIVALFVCDAIVTVNAIAKLNRDLGRIDVIAKHLHAGSDALAEKLGDGALAADEKLGAARTETEMRLDLARADWADKKYAIRARLLRAFPDMKNTHYSAEALSALRSWYTGGKK